MAAKYIGGRRSKTTKNYGDEGKRVLQPRLEGSETHEFLEFLSTDPEALIGQWISVIDKIFWKPKPGKNIGAAQFELRDKLGKAMWKNLAKRLGQKVAEEYRDKWENRLHPYGTDKKKFVKSDELKSGRDYERFLGQIDIETLVIVNGLAKNIENHLHKKARPKKAGKTGEHARPGVIEARAKAIETSHMDRRMLPKPVAEGEAIERPNGFDFSTLKSRLGGPGWSEKDQQDYKRVDDLAARIYRAADDFEKKRKHEGLRFGPKEVGGVLYRHYRKVFGQSRIGKKGKSQVFVPPRHVIKRNGQRRLLLLHDTVREFYKNLLRNTKKKKVANLVPRNAESLFKRLDQQHNNRVTNDLVRLGRVLHYEASQEGIGEFALMVEETDTDTPHIWKLEETELRESKWFLSDGQAAIKRAEAFVRIWRNFTSQAARSLKYWADPNDNLDEDILSETSNRKLIDYDDNAVERVRKHLSLLFGRDSALFETNPMGTLEYALSMLTIARHQIFHFRSREQFVQILKDELSWENVGTEQIPNAREADFKDGLSKAAEAAGELYLSDRQNMARRFHEVLSAAFVDKFVRAGQYTKLLNSIIKAKPGDMMLPKFNRLLARLEGPGLLKIDDERSIPGPASMQKLTSEVRKARYVGLKLVYERPFKQWLEQEVTPEQLHVWLKAAADLSTTGAKDDTDKPHEGMVLSRAQRLFERMPDDTTIHRFPHLLTAATAQEMQVQQGYESKGDNARNQAAWIENYRCDVLGRAFHEFLKTQSVGTRDLLVANEESPEHAGMDWNDLDINIEAQEKPEWANALYLLLHLSPADDASMLLHQIRKWQAVEEKGTGDKISDEPVTDLREVFDTYNAMHDAKFDGEGVEIDLNSFKELFEQEGDFNALFKIPDSQDEKLAGTQRGLRQVLRFGHQRALAHIFDQHKVTSDEVQTFKDFDKTHPKGEGETTAEWLHTRYQKLHAKAVKTFGKTKDMDIAEEDKFTSQDIKEYRAIVEELKTFRQTSNKVKLVNHTHLHRIMMRVLARLVDYAGLWERDQYFITLALLKIHQPDDTRADAGKLRTWICDQLFANPAMKPLGKFLNEGQLPVPDALAADMKKHLGNFHEPGGRTTRNSLAHFNILKPDSGPINLSRQVDATRQMLKYDRKLKNAVTKSIIDMLDQEGFDLSWEFEGHRVGKATLKPREIDHLAFMKRQIGDWACEAEGIPLPPKRVGYLKRAEWEEFKKKEAEAKKRKPERIATSAAAQISEPRHSDTYCKMVQALFE